MIEVLYCTVVKLQRLQMGYHVHYCHAKTYIPYQQMGTTERYIKVSDQRTLLYIMHVIMSHGGIRHGSM